MIDLISFNKVFKSTWVKKYLDPENHGKWKLFLDWELQLYGGPVIFQGNLNRHGLSKFINTTCRCLYYRNFTTLVRDKLRGECELYWPFSFITSMEQLSDTNRQQGLCITNRGAVKVSRTLQTFLETRIPFYLLMNFRNDTMLKQTF